MITTEEIVKELNAAVKKHGEYALQDKGASEVMNLAPIVTRLSQMPPEKAAAVIVAVHNTNDSGAVLAGDLVSSRDSSPEAWWDAMFAADKTGVLADLY